MKHTNTLVNKHPCFLTFFVKHLPIYPTTDGIFFLYYLPCILGVSVFSWLNNNSIISLPLSFKYFLWKLSVIIHASLGSMTICSIFHCWKQCCCRYTLSWEHFAYDDWPETSSSSGNNKYHWLFPHRSGDFYLLFFCLGFVQICNRLADLAFLYKIKTNVTVNVLLFYPCVALFSHKSLCSAVFLNN